MIILEVTVNLAFFCFLTNQILAAKLSEINLISQSKKFEVR